ncbi:MAG: ATP-binding protein [Saprospiraceae bacterium]|nr:ATP-binding protein [Saprospiraceae bacterium]
MKPLKFVLLGLFFAVTTAAHSQTRQIRFSEVTGASGISLGKINAITQDERGFLWLSDQTNRCIIRYDGSHMKRYAYDPDAEFSMGGFYPEALFADDDGIVWIGYFGQGLDRLDTKTNEVTHWQHSTEDPSSLPDNFVTAILRDHRGLLWIGHYGGVSILDEQTGGFTTYQHIPNDTASLSLNTVRTIYEDKEGTIWVGCGFPWNFDEGGGLNRFNRETRSFTQYLHDPDDPNSLVHNKVRAIFEDSRGNFWVGSLGDGLHTLDRETGKFTRHVYNPADPTALSRSPVNNQADHITFISEDSENQIWIGTEDNGLLRYDPISRTKVHYGEGAEESSGFDQRSGWAMHAMDNGLLYVSTQTAKLYKVDLNNYVIPNHTDVPAPRTFFRSSESELWIGSWFGLYIKNLSTGKVRWYAADTDDPNSLSNDIVQHIFQDSKGSMWISTFEGLNKYISETDNFKVYRRNPDDPKAIQSVDVASIAEDSRGMVWIGSYGEGLNRYDPTADQFTHYRSVPSDQSTLSGDWACELFVEDDDHLLIGMRGNNGLNRMQISTGKVERFLPGLNIVNIYRDSRNKIWLGTTNGLYHKSVEGAFVTYKNAHLTQGINVSIRSIVEDDFQNLWLGTNLGLYRLNADRSRMVLFNQNNGLQGDNQGHLGSAFRNPDGQLFFVGNDRYYSLQPSDFQTIEDESEIIFTEFWLADKALKYEDHAGLDRPIHEAAEISLEHNEDVFSIGFSKIDFRSAEQAAIQYMLENYDLNWRDAFMGERLNYYNVPPGHYTLHIKALNTTNGVWAEKSMDIRIAKPWWVTWWAYLLYAGIIAFLGWRVHLFQKARVVRSEREKNREKELEHAREVEKAYSDLKGTQAQLIQSEKMASLGELTAGIAHEIQNPLNFVNNFSEVSTELIDDIEDELKNGNQNSALELGQDLKNNLEKIVHHGQRASAIVKSMLLHSRADSGKKELVDINTLADEYLRLAYHGMRARDKSFNASIKTEFDPSLKEIEIVPQEIGRVLLNLITNAFHAMSEKKERSENGFLPEVQVSTRKLNDSVEISVKDNGGGIPKNIRDKVFQPFFTTKPTGEGTGLGLSLSYDIVKAHGGELKVETKEGEGTEFIVELPIA